MPARTDRLLDLVRLLSDGRLHRAEDLASRLGVSQRTIYRDMDTLVASGVPIAGERGLGYAATAAITLPPLNLTLPELEALHLGLAVVGEAGDEELKGSARTLSEKIDAVLPEDRSARGATFGFATHAFAEASRGFRHMPAIRAAIRARQKLRLRMPADPIPRRIVRPLRLDYWGRVWAVTAWDETAAAFQLLRVDLIEEVTVLPQLFVDEPGRTLADYQATLG
ncbi:MAG TPA: HTH domain-containing protein [Rubellimicrobium sp.]|nr:HTH domain-containing protein [Rubellimicrobium sp.]